MSMPQERGFVALISVIIIGAVLLAVVIGASLTGFYSRYNVLDFELKERSASAADACANQALLELANDATYAGGTTLSLNSLDTCHVGPVTLVGTGEKSIRIQATSSDAVTNLFVVVNTSDLSIASWREVPNY